MAFVNMNFYSDILNMDTDVAVLLPETRHGADTLHPDKKYPVVYVLHGYGDNHTAWIRKSVIEMVTRTLECVIVMPSGRNSYYVNGKNGFYYYDFITKELPIKMANFFPISTKREDTYIMGNSMGGYGSFLLAMSKPEQYAAAVSFSGVLGLDYQNALCVSDPKLRYQTIGAMGTEEEFYNSDYYLFNLVKKLDKYEGEKPRLYAICGSDDELCYEGNERFINYARNNTSIFVKYDVSRGNHNFDFWNEYVAKAFEFMGLK